MAWQPKIDRMNKLKRLDLNCPEYLVIKSLRDCRKLLRHDLWSIRSYPMDGRETVNPLVQKSVLKALTTYPIERGIVPPHAPVISSTMGFSFAATLLVNGFTPMACKCINPMDAIWAGAAILFPKKLTIEVAANRGHGVMVRQVTRDGEIDHAFDFNVDVAKIIAHGNPPTPKVFLVGIAEAFLEILKSVPVNNVVELSWYKNPVGWKEEQLIFWDIHPINKYGVE